jgi:putative oxidoreductase
MNLKIFFTANAGAGSTNIGLLVLRAAALSLFLRHGLEKLTGYWTMVQHFPDPIHIGAHASLAFALLSDGICSLLVLIGLATRPAAAVILVNLLAAFFFVHHAAYFSNGHVELVALHIIIFATLLFTGPGQFSIDSRQARLADEKHEVVPS